MLTPEEAALWAQVANTVAPLEGNDPAPWGEGDRRRAAAVVEGKLRQRAVSAPASRTDARSRAPLQHASHGPPPRAGEDFRRHGLDASWDRNLSRGVLEPDFTLDLHGCSLDAAHGRLMHGLVQAKAMGARIVLLVTGKPRPADAADRSSRRGAIRAKVIDWLAASEHALDIAAIRGAHRKHGGQGALYVVLKKRR